MKSSLCLLRAVGPKGITDHGSYQSVSETDECTTCAGASAPNFKLLDVNPTSCGIGQYFCLEAFEGWLLLLFCCVLLAAIACITRKTRTDAL